VVKQSPKAGKSVKAGTLVTLYISQGGTAVPNVVGQNYEVAIGQLGNSGLTNIHVVYQPDSGAANGTVISQNPHAGQHVSPSTQITLTVVKNQSSPPPSPTPSPTPTPTSTQTASPPPTPPK
jgi:serine/threonine-protein kinase